MSSPQPDHQIPETPFHGVPQRMKTPFKTPKTRRNLKDLKEFIDASRRGDYNVVTNAELEL